MVPRGTPRAKSEGRRAGFCPSARFLSLNRGNFPGTDALPLHYKWVGAYEISRLPRSAWTECSGRLLQPAAAFNPAFAGNRHWPRSDDRQYIADAGDPALGPSRQTALAPPSPPSPHASLTGWRAGCVASAPYPVSSQGTSREFAQGGMSDRPTFCVSRRRALTLHTWLRNEAAGKPAPPLVGFMSF